MAAATQLAERGFLRFVDSRNLDAAEITRVALAVSEVCGIAELERENAELRAENERLKRMALPVSKDMPASAYTDPQP